METKQTKEYLRYTFSEDEKKELSVKLDAGYEMRTVDCEWRYGFDTGIKNLWRMDTGELVRQEKISQDEAQAELL